MAALGLGSGLIWDTGTAYPPIINPLNLYYMMLWWDFTDTSTLFQEIDSFTTAADANNDLIGRVKNKAIIAQTQYNAWLDDEDRLGVFGRAPSTSNRPAFKTGGANGYGYAQFTGSGSDYLECKQAAGYGVHSGTSLSDAKLSSHQWTLVIVAQADAAGDSTSTEEICSIQMTHDTDTDKAIKMQVDRMDDGGSDDGDIRLHAVSTDDDYSSSLAVTNTTMADTTNTQMNDKLEVRIISANISPASLSTAQRGLNITGGMPGGYDALTASEGAIRIYSFDEANNDAHFRVGIGYAPTGGRYFDGKIYEIIFYKGGIDTSTANGLAWWYADKYGIDIEGAN